MGVRGVDPRSRWRGGFRDREEDIRVFVITSLCVEIRVEGTRRWRVSEVWTLDCFSTTQIGNGPVQEKTVGTELEVRSHLW